MTEKGNHAMKHLLSYLYICLFIAVLSPMTALSVYGQKAATTETTQTGYVQFSGMGRTVLYVNDARTPVAGTPNETTPSDATYKWTLSFTLKGTMGTNVQLKNGDGRWLVFSNNTFATTTDASQATSFSWTSNTYYTQEGLDRHQLEIPGLSGYAVGVTSSGLTVVKKNSRYAVVLITDNVVGPTLPTMSSINFKYYYNIGTQWGDDAVGKDWLYTSGTESTSVRVGDASNKTKDAYKWSITEANDMGDVVFKTKDGWYITQASANDPYTRTSSRSDAAVFRLVEAIDQGQVSWYNQQGKQTNINGQYWYDFWQLRNVGNNAYFFEGNQQQMGGLKSNLGTNYSSTIGKGLGNYCYAFNRLRFEATGDAEQVPHFMQLTGEGRAVLSTTDDGQELTARTLEAGATMDDAYAWYPDANTNNHTIRLQNADKRWLAYHDGKFSFTTNASDATAFGWTQNTYYEAEGIVRYQMLLPGQEEYALGVRNGTFSIVKANSRYAVMLITEDIVGADLPEMSTDKRSHLYNIGTTWGNNNYGKDWLYTRSNSTAHLQVAVTENKSDLSGDAYKWKMIEANEWGDVYLVTQDGWFLTQKSATDGYSRTDLKREATIFRLTEAVDQGKVALNTKESWADFWQLKNTANGTFFFEGSNNQMGGTSNALATSGFNEGLGKYCYSFNRVKFADTGETSSFENYLQFSGMGRHILYEQSGKVMARELQKDITQLPADSCLWIFDTSSANGVYLRNGLNHFLRIEKGDKGYTFSAVADMAQATLLTTSHDTYYNAEGINRYNVLLASDNTLALGIDNNGVLTMVPAGSRYAVIRMSDNVKGAEAITLSNSEVQKVYNLAWLYEDSSTSFSKNYVYANAPSAFTSTANSLQANSLRYQWTLEATSDGSGDFYLKSMSGYYAAQTSTAASLSLTDKESSAARFRLVEADDKAAKYADHWQMKNVDNGQFIFVGWSNAYGGTSNGINRVYDGVTKGNYNYSNNRMIFIPIEAKLRGYILFSGLGPFPLCDGNDHGRPFVHHGVKDINYKGHKWVLVSHKAQEGNSTVYQLKSDQDNYIGWDAKRNFFTTADPAEAYPFRLRYSTYQNNECLRYELCSAEGKALSSNWAPTKNMSDELFWGNTGTRYSVLRFADFISGPTLPEANARGKDLAVYTINTSSEDFSHRMLCDSISANLLSSELIPDEDYTSQGNRGQLSDYVRYCWVATPTLTNGKQVGDCIVRSFRGNYLSYDATKSRFYVTTDASKAAIIRLIENDFQTDSWQLQYIGTTATDGTFTPFTSQTNIFQYKPNTGTSTTNGNYFTLGSPSSQYNYLRVDTVDVYPGFSNEQGGTLRSMVFYHVTGSPALRKVPSSDVVDANGTNNTVASVTWKLIGNRDDFVVRQYDNSYIAYDAATKRFFATTDKAQAMRFRMMQNTLKTGDIITWCFCPLGADGLLPDAPQCIQRNDDGSLSLVDYQGNYTKAETGIYVTPRTSPYFSSSEKAYYQYLYFPATGTSPKLYLTGSDNGDLRAYAAQKAINQVNPSQGKVEFLNNQLWAFVGPHDDFVIMSRDSTYLAYNAAGAATEYDVEERSDCFVPVTDYESAAHFLVHSDEDNPLKGDYSVQYIRGETVTGQEGKFLQMLHADAVSANPTTGQSARDAYWYLGLQESNAPALIPEDWTVSDAEDYKDYRIIHKRPWFVREAQDLPSEVSMTGFVDKDNTPGFTQNEYTGDLIQQTNVFTTHFYVKDGTQRYFYLPSMSRFADVNTGSVIDVSASTIRAYQRFYNYETEGPLDSHRVILKRKSRRKYANGTVMGSLLNLNRYYGAFVGEEVTFQMPVLTPDHYRYTMGLDASAYTDFVDYFGDNALVYEDTLRTTQGVALPELQNMVEPTLSGRYLYVVHNAREMADSLARCYDGSDQWIETHEITFPKKKVNFKNCTVPLNMQLQNYWIYDSNLRDATPEEKNRSLVNLTNYKYLKFEVEGNAGIQVYYPSGVTADDQLPIDGASHQNADLSTCRFIRFLYPKAKADGTVDRTTKSLALPDEIGFAWGDSAVIKIYAYSPDSKKSYNLARFVLHFADDTEPLPYTEVLGYATSTSGTPLSGASKYLSPRSPQALAEEYGGARATIDFNAERFKPFLTPPFGVSTTNKRYNRVSTGSNQPLASSTTLDYSYGVPLLYEHTSYDFQPYIYNNANSMSENTWGSYTICRQFKVNWISSSKNTYHPVRTLYKQAYTDKDYDDTDAAFMYIDASELPGKFCSLEYNGSLCKGSRLYFSAWLSSPDALWRNVSTKTGGDAPGNVILTVKGIQVDPLTQKAIKEVVLYNYCPGPIFEVARNADGTTLSRGENEEGVWQQVYFSFINNHDEDFQRYELTLDNACTNSNGGDIMIDEVQMFAMKPTVKMERTTPVCGQHVTLAKLTCDYSSMLSSLGLKENETPSEGMPRMWYCVLDKEAYEKELQGITRPTQADVQRAFDAALVGDPQSNDDELKAFRSVSFSTRYTDIPQFSYREALSDKVKGAIIRRETDSKGERHMIISDKVSASKMKGNHKYYLVFVPRYGDSPITEENAVAEFQVGDSCCIRSEFETAASASFIDEAADSLSAGNLITVCANQSVNITAKLNGINQDGTLATIQPMYDWWLDYVACDFTHVYITADGTIQEYADAQAHQQGEVSLREALINFRHYYPTATSLNDVTPHTIDPAYVLTSGQIAGLKTLVQPTLEEVDDQGNITSPGHMAPLHLYATSLNLTMPEPEGDPADAPKNVITLLPIEVNVADTVVYCFDPQQLRIAVTGIAPKMNVGFRPLESVYPQYMDDATLRIGKDFLPRVSASSFITPPDEMLRIPLRNITVVSTETAIGLKKIDREGMKYAPVYLVGTNDASMRVYDETAGVADFRQVGRVYALSAPRSNSSGIESYADLFFFSDFQPREGYYYTLRFGYVEEFPADHEQTEAESTVCDGSLVFDLCIVPRYQVWTGNAGTTDWTDDNNWARADHADLLQSATASSYLSNADNGTAHGYVPMYFTNVVISSKAKQWPRLYAIDDNGETDRIMQFNSANAPTPRTATKDIEYDLVVDGKLSQQVGTATYYVCRPFHTYTCSDIVLQQGTEIVHSERLLSYDKAWMEYGIRAGRWYTLGSPFQRMYAGDWYAPTLGGRQQSPYFQSVSFQPALHDRFSPAVYQRGWDKATASVYYLQNGTGTTTLSADVAIKADWSAVYNDVTERYDQGGFSLKVNPQGKAGRKFTNLLFRLPKEDETYSYYKHEGTGTYDQHTVTVARADAQGTVQGPNLTARLNTDLITSATPTLTQTLTNHAAGNRYFLVSNPFTCGLDMREFFRTNGTDVIQPEYWLLTEQGQTAVMRGPGATGWISVNADTEASEGILAPGQGFFVVANAQAVKQTTEGSQLQVKFTADMQTSVCQPSGQVALRSPKRTSPLPLLRITAHRDSMQSEAILGKTSEATNHFSAAEDMQLLLDGTQPDAPMVYTTADSVATTINLRRSLFRVPIGVMSSSDAPVSLTFSGMSGFNETLSLLDDQTGAVYPLTLASGTGQTDSVTVEVPGITSGRFYLLSSEQPSPEEQLTDDRPYCIVSQGSVSIYGNALHPLTYVQVVDAAGRELYHLTPFLASIKLKLPAGAYVIDARTQTKRNVMKVSVE